MNREETMKKMSKYLHEAVVKTRLDIQPKLIIGNHPFLRRNFYGAWVTPLSGNNIMISKRMFEALQRRDRLSKHADIFRFVMAHELHHLKHVNLHRALFFFIIAPILILTALHLPVIYAIPVGLLVTAIAFTMEPRADSFAMRHYPVGYRHFIQEWSQTPYEHYPVDELDPEEKWRKEFQKRIREEMKSKR